MKIERRKAERSSCKIPAKITLPVCNEDEEIIEISGTAINISASGLALEIISDNPYKAKGSNLLWERVLSREMLSILPIEILTENSVSSLSVNGIITWNSMGKLVAGIDDLSLSDTDFKSYQLGFHYYIMDEVYQEQIKSCVAEITSTAFRK